MHRLDVRLYPYVHKAQTYIYGPNLSVRAVQNVAQTAAYGRVFGYQSFADYV